MMLLRCLGVPKKEAVRYLATAEARRNEYLRSRGNENPSLYSRIFGLGYVMGDLTIVSVLLCLLTLIRIAAMSGRKLKPEFEYINKYVDTDNIAIICSVILVASTVIIEYLGQVLLMTNPFHACMFKHILYAKAFIATGVNLVIAGFACCFMVYERP